MSEILTKITSALSGDIVFLLATFIVIFLCVMYLGKNKMVPLVLAFYPATFLYKSFPFVDKFIVLSGEKSIVLNKIGIFLVFFIFIYFVIKKYIAQYDELSSVFRKGMLTLAILVIILLFSYITVNFDILHNFSDSIDTLFNGGDRVFWWSLAPLVLLAFI